MSWQIAAATLSHNQWLDQVVEWGRRGAWRTYVIHDSRTQHWATDTGWPDIFLVDAFGLGRGALAIECKTGSGRERADQRAWREVLTAAGVRCYVVYPRDGQWLRALLLDGVPLHALVRRATMAKSVRKGSAQKNERSRRGVRAQRDLRGQQGRSLFPGEPR